MRIAYLAAGAGPMYCGSCLHSNALAKALQGQGADAVLVPLYTPLRVDEESVSLPRLAMGGINVYVQQRWPILSRMPRWAGWLLDRPALIRWAARRGGQTRAERLGALTLAMLRGNDGALRNEVDKLTAWLSDELRPDVVHLSNVLLAGLARPLAERLGVPVVCSLTGEDIFLEKLPQPYYDEARGLLRQRAADLSALVAMNDYYAHCMASYLEVPRGRIHVVRPGLDLEPYRRQGLAPTSLATTAAESTLSPPVEITEISEKPAVDSAPVVIGYLARICFEKGLHQLVEVLRRFDAEGGTPTVRVAAAGYLDRADRGYFRDIQRQLARLGLADRFDYVGEPSHAGKIEFLRSLDVLCLPTVYQESKGLSVYEAWACGVPAVLPAHGAFPEMIAETGGGLLYEPGNASSLTEALRRMLGDPPSAAEFGRRGQQAIFERYQAGRMARDTLAIYEQVTKNG